MKNAINWFEIPAADFQRAKKFYETILECDIQVMDFQGKITMGFLPSDQGAVGGAICHNPEFYSPTDKGVLVYLNANPDLDIILARIEKAGGKVLIKKTLITEEYGYMAIFIDTEGNRIALHSSE